MNTENARLKSNEEYESFIMKNKNMISNPGVVLKKKSERGTSNEKLNEPSDNQTKQTLVLKTVKRKNRDKFIDKKHSHIYIEKNLSYSPSVVNGLGKSSHTPSLIIRNNLRNVDKISPYNYNKSRNPYSNKYTNLSSNTSSTNRLNEHEFLGYSPYQKYKMNKIENTPQLVTFIPFIYCLKSLLFTLTFILQN
jgi:hypothetical protein